MWSAGSRVMGRGDEGVKGEEGGEESGVRAGDGERERFDGEGEGGH